jgi:peptidoglycan/xylan/chitin deacetylase (PgdA/CDA1 family)
MYHGISRIQEQGINGRHLPIEQFEKQLMYFKKHFEIVSVSALCEMKLKSINLKKHTIALTFDDGYLNNISNALPLLKKYQVPATLFISSPGLTDRNYIQPTDFLDLINLSIHRTVEINGKLFRKDKYHLVANDGSASSIYEYVNSLNFSSWKKTFSDLWSRFPYSLVTENVASEFYEVISGSDLRALVDSELITVGSHGHNHVSLERLSDEEIADELKTSIDIFQNRGAKGMEILAFPFGSFNKRVISISQKLGFKILIAGGAIETGVEEMVFPRIGILNLGSFSYNVLSINRGFSRFGF